MRKEIKKKEEIRIVHYICCPLCDKEIKGTSPSQVDYNLKLHLEKCEKEKVK